MPETIWVLEDSAANNEDRTFNMPGNRENPRDLLREYADILMADSQAAYQQQRDEVADVLIEITRKLEENGVEVAQQIYVLLKENPEK